MTRETIKEYILQVKSQDRTEALYNRWEPNILVEIINQIFDDHEALQQPKSCAKCKAFKLDDEHNDGFGQCFWGIYFPNRSSSSYHKGTDFYCSEFEAKEQ